MLAFWTRVAKEHRIGWFAVAGTLLGAVRNQGIIPFDDDIDLGVRCTGVPAKWRQDTDDRPVYYG
jgi:hypothetical protein